MWIALVVVVTALLYRFAGFSSQRPGHYAGQGPAFDPRHHLNGPILCEGVIYGPLGRVTARFVAQMEGRWDGNRGTLTERFHYDSGESQNREWRLSLGNDGTISAEADDVVGTGSGKVSGPAVQMLYRLRLPKGAGGHVLSVNDWMYLTENGTIMNRSQFRKFGLKVGELVATMRPVAA
ncbi:MAG: DUF3833 domain-containing protein [Candidatus Saccharibacteria bacterium]|nr:DUF3833 domain-containing protein [Pseudorhodobacter sp.]